MLVTGLLTYSPRAVGKQCVSPITGLIGPHGSHADDSTVDRLLQAAQPATSICERICSPEQSDLTFSVDFTEIAAERGFGGDRTASQLETEPEMEPYTVAAPATLDGRVKAADDKIALLSSLLQKL